MAMGKEKRLAKYQKACNQFERARLAKEAAFHVAFPIGSSVTWMRGGRVQRGEITMLSRGTRVRACVRNSKTGREYWLDEYWFMARWRDS